MAASLAEPGDRQTAGHFASLKTVLTHPECKRTINAMLGTGAHSRCTALQCFEDFAAHQAFKWSWSIANDPADAGARGIHWLCMQVVQAYLYELFTSGMYGQAAELMPSLLQASLLCCIT